MDVGADQRSSDETKYKGVRKRKWGKWVSEIRLPNSRERIWLGSYDTPVKAARAFDAALFCLRGRNSSFNFPHTPPDITGAQTLTPHEIQAVAAQYANNNDDQYNPNTVESDQPHTSTAFLEHTLPSLTSNGVDTMDSNLPTDWSFLDSFETVGTTSTFPDYSLYSGTDNVLSDELYFTPQVGPNDYYHHNIDEDGNVGDHSVQDSLWNF